MRHLMPTLIASKGKDLRLLDVGCGFGYSTLLYARLATIIRKSAGILEVVGCDYHKDFIEKSIANLAKYPIETAKVRFL